MKQVGVGYVELDRPVSSLSGGEAQRIRLASCIGSGLSGVCFVLDEPTIGLHPRDTDRLLDVLSGLKERENSVLVVEHDAETMRRADWIVDLGPEAGRHGGTIIHQGTFNEFLEGPGATSEFLSGRRHVSRPPRQSDELPLQDGTPTKDAPSLLLESVHHHNLDDVSVQIPLASLVAVTGVSGSGKSSLVVDMLVPIVRRELGLTATVPGSFKSVKGIEHVKHLVEVDQSPIGRTPRSCPASFSGILDPIRQVFTKSREARLRGFGPGRFSFNSKEGQCTVCEGLGARRIDLQFMPDMYVPCTACRGRRYNRATLSVRFKGKSMADVLEMTVEEALEYFDSHPRIARILSTLRDVGLGYLQLGQWGTTLSGGEAQRLKLATELAKANAEPTLYVLDEPTTGLHFQDVEQLLALLSRLVDQGHTVVVVEHNLDLIAASDWVIDLGPEGGNAGGRIVATGTPRQIAERGESPTSLALRRHLSSVPDFGP